MTHFTLAGAALDSGNLGVAALATAVLEAVDAHGEGADVVVFDNGLGTRPGSVTAGDRSIAYRSIGMRRSRRWYKPESLFQMNVAARTGLPNPAVSAIATAAACFDISGGDSFTDMYGPDRFQTIAQPKELVNRVGAPLVLLPQTYGPYYGPEARSAASTIVRRSSIAWARDQRSFDTLCELLGDDLDPERHHLGVDVAFGLSPTEPDGGWFDDVKAWLAQPGPVAGVNISGLLMSTMSKRTTRDELAIDYAKAMTEFIDRLLATTNARVLLAPHVLGRLPGLESDELAIEELVKANQYDPDRVRVIPADGLTANTAKWWISQCDWFCGARMHSTIAGLSTGVPTAAIAYSIKTAPVFATVGQEAEVIDAKTANTSSVVDFLLERWHARDQTRNSLADDLPVLRDKLQHQMRTIVGSALQARVLHHDQANGGS